MMEGITVLSETQRGVCSWHWPALWICVAAFALIGALVFFFKFDRCISTFLDLIMCIVFFSLVGAVWGMLPAAYIPTSHETVYEVIIDDSVSMTEFIEQYEIVDQRGEIFTIKERGDGDA